jgi:hypothetical protein
MHDVYMAMTQILDAKNKEIQRENDTMTNIADINIEEESSGT